MRNSFELGAEFIDRENIPLSVDDLEFCFERGWPRAATVIDSALCEVEHGNDDVVLLEVASLLSDDVNKLPDVLPRLGLPDHIHDPGESARKWLYLELKAAFDHRGDLDDPLGVVEQIYADFDYPPSVE